MSNRGMFKKLGMIIIVAFMLVTNFHINVRAEDELEPTEEPAVTETTETETVEEVLPEEVVVEEETLPVEETEEVVVEEETLPVEETEEVVLTPTEEVKEEKVVEESFAESKTIDGITISVNAEPGVFPNGSTLSVRKVTASEEQKVQEAVDEQRDYSCNVAATYTFDIKVLDSEGNEVQPTEGKKVEVTFQLEEVLNTNLETSVYHIDDEETATALDIQENEDTVSVETDGFSYYTVEFTYYHLEYSIEGGSKVALSTILENIGLTGTITNAVSSNPDLFSVNNSSGEWVLTSLQAFDTHETLTVTINGIEHVIEVTDSQHSHSSGSHGESGTWSPWSDSANLPTASGNYYLNTDVTRSRPQIPKSGTATIKLCLNGHKITLSGGNNGLYDTDSSRKVNLTIYDSDDNSGIITNTSTYGSVIRIKGDGSTYTLAGGKITNCNCSSWNTPVYVDGGTFTMKGGMICNNTLTDYAPVYVASGTFNMSGGTITGNTNKKASGVVASGVHVASGTFNMSGGSITNNNSPDANSAAGVYFQNSGLFNVKGKVTITGNTSKGKDLNVLVINNKTIGINGNLDSDSRIGVTTATAPSGSTTIQFTNGLSGKGSKTNFISDNPDYTVMIKNNEAHLIAHKHEFEYSADGDTITATCVNMVTDCPLEDRKATLKIVAPALKVYGGSESEKATLEGEIPGVTPPAIVYLDGPESSTTAPKNAGMYTAEITLGTSPFEATASVDYKIDKADITPVVNIDNWNYGETPKTPSVTSASNPGGGAVSYKYYIDAECTTETGTAQGATTSGGVPSKGGNYWVKATVAETDNYKSGTGTKGFEILAKNVTATGITFDSRVYDGTTNADLDVSNAQLVGVALGDDVRIKSATGEFVDKNVGTGKTIKNIVIELEGDDAGGYSATSDPATITGAITPKTVTVTEGITAEDKDYDGNTNATVDTSGATIDGIVGDDELEVIASGQFVDANVGNGKTVNLTVTGLDGEDKGNYELASSGHQATTTASILPLTMQLEVTGYEGVYDEQDHHITVNVIEPTSDAHISYKGPNDTEFTHVNPTFQDPGEYVVEYRVTHAHYKVETGTATVKIIGKDFEGIGSEGYEDKYDQNPHTIGLTLSSDCEEGCKVTYAESESGPYSDDPITYTDFTGGEKKVYFKVTKKGYNDYIDYDTVNILKKPVTVSGIEAEEKTYDGTEKAELVFDNVVIDGKIDGDDLEVKASGRFADKNAEEDKEVAIEDLALTGLASENYELASSGQQTTTTATINKKQITVSGITSPGKTYDGNTNAPLYLEDAHLEGKISGDDLSVTATGAFEDPDAGSNKTITISNLTLVGDTQNYELAPTGQQTETTGNIAVFSVVVNADDKEKYYGEDDPEFTYESIPSKLIGDDVLEGELSRQEGEDVGTYEITLGSLHDHEGNYAIEYTKGTLTIKKATSNSVTASIEGWTYGDDPNEPTATATHGVDTATFTYSDAIDGDYTSTVPTDAGTYYVKAHIADTDNYPEATSDPVEFEIAKKEIELEWGETEFTYNGKVRTPEATAKGLVGNDECTVEVDGGKTDSNQKDGSDYYEATAARLSNDNYKLPSNKTTKFTIAPKELNYDMLELEGGDVLEADGSEKGPTIGLDDEDILEDNVPYELKEGEDYTVSGDATATNPGTYSFTIEGTGNYTGTLTSSWVLTNNMQNYDEEPAVDGVGKLAVFVDVIGNTENIKVDGFTLDLAKGLLTDEEIEKRSEGENVLVYMEIFEIPKSEVDETDRKLIMKEFNKEGATDFRWFNVMVYKKIGNEQAQEVHETYKDVKITIAIPKDYKDAPNGYSRTYYLGRAHDGKGSIINTTDNKQIYTSTHEFSIYALAYKDTKRNTPKYVDPNLLSVPNTADPTDLGLWIMMMLLSIASFFTLKRVKKGY